jgi:hypothetical protein
VDDDRIQAVMRAVGRLAAWSRPVSLSDGLSAPMAARCLSLATGAIHADAIRDALAIPGRPPSSAAVVAARGVFSAPLEWVVLLAAAGARVHLKAPRAASSFSEALTEVFEAEGLPVEVSTRRELPDVEALVAMGSDAALAALARRHAHARLSLHGHRLSVAVVRDTGSATAAALCDDAALYDGRGCFSPVAVFVLPPGDPSALHDNLASSFEEAQRLWPRGAVSSALGPEWRRRTGLAKSLGSLRESEAWATTVLPASFFEASPLPRFLPIHPVRDLGDVSGTLASWSGHLAACATDLMDVDSLLAMGFERICRPGRLQLPPFGRPHGKREPLRPLFSFPSVE